MTKRLVDIDNDALAGARAELGTVTIRDTVNEALRKASSLTVLHYDRDFDHIAAVTGQRTEWVVPSGSID